MIAAARTIISLHRAMGSPSYRFGDFTLDCRRRQLLRHGEPVHLSPKAYELLQVLVDAAPGAVSKAELQERIWPDTFVVEANLQHLVAEIRRALGDTPQAPRHVRTVFGFGYAFHHPFEAAEAEGPGGTCRLHWDDGGATLATGAYTIGRDATADVVLDFATVSRQHARLQVSREGVALEDLGSKNGTFVGDRRVHGRVVLADGDEVRFGRVPVLIRIGSTDATETARTEVNLRGRAARVPPRPV
jgi:DNA-binding winged helix-turn-helix (wHTH) protein